MLVAMVTLPHSGMLIVVNLPHDLNIYVVFVMAPKDAGSITFCKLAHEVKVWYAEVQ
jgi:hypothetical protein